MNFIPCRGKYRRRHRVGCDPFGGKATMAKIPEHHTKPTSAAPDDDPLHDKLLFLRDVYVMWGDCSHMKIARARKADPAFPRAVYPAGSRRPMFWRGEMVRYLRAQADKPPTNGKPLSRGRGRKPAQATA
jgi:hypothetical protein